MLSRFLIHPLARGTDIDSPSTTSLRRRIVQEKVFLRKIYDEWYTKIAAALPGGPPKILEIGAGAGFLADAIPGVITSEIFWIPGLDLVLDCRQLPFGSATLKAVVMTDVFHHIPHPALFLDEAARCVRAGGAMVMIEPWNSPWSRWVYQTLHHEPFRPDAREWEFPSTGPLSGANGALPWIVFGRDRERLAKEHPQWSVASIEPMMPLRYLLSGGVTYRSFTPPWTFSLWRAMERLLPLRHCAMFACIRLERTAAPAHRSQSSAVRLSS